MTIERRISNRKQTPGNTWETKKTHTFLTTMYHGTSSMRSLQREQREKEGESEKKDTGTREGDKDESL